MMNEHEDMALGELVACPDEQRDSTLDELNDWLLRAWSVQRGLRG